MACTVRGQMSSYGWVGGRVGGWVWGVDVTSAMPEMAVGECSR